MFSFASSPLVTYNTQINPFSQQGNTFSRKPPLHFNTQGNNVTTGNSVLGSGFSFDLPLTHLVTGFANLGSNFQANATNNAFGFLGNVIQAQNSLLGNAYTSNVNLNQNAQGILNQYITTASNISSANAQAAGQASQNSGGLFGGGGFLGLGF